MGSQLVKLLSLLVFASLSISGLANATCLNVEGEYSLKDEASGETVLLHVEQKECNQINVVYDYGESGKSARIMMLNERPVVYLDSLEHSYIETYKISDSRIYAYAIEIIKKQNKEIHTKSEIYLDEKKNWVEEIRTFPLAHEAEAKYEKLVFQRLN
jgi:hypothetical protein